MVYCTDVLPEERAERLRSDAPVFVASATPPLCSQCLILGRTSAENSIFWSLCGLFSILLKIDLYLDTLDPLVISCFSPFEVSWWRSVTHFLGMCFLLHWHSDLTLTASCSSCTDAADDYKLLIIFNWISKKKKRFNIRLTKGTGQESSSNKSSWFVILNTYVASSVF